MEDLCKHLKLHLSNCPTAAFKTWSMEEMVQEHKELVKELLLLTCKLNAKWLDAGLRDSFQKISKATAKACQ